ncbi:hypothetical protein ACQ4PT_059340 [Festuca glaucescens]
MRLTAFVFTLDCGAPLGPAAFVFILPPFLAAGGAAAGGAAAAAGASKNCFGILFLFDGMVAEIMTDTSPAFGGPPTGTSTTAAEGAAYSAAAGGDTLVGPTAFHAATDTNGALAAAEGSAQLTCYLFLQESGMSKSQLGKSLNKIESAVSDACKILEQLNLPGVSNDKGRRVVSTSSCSAAITVGPLRVIGRDQDRDKIIAMLHENEHQCQVNTVSGTCYSVIGIHGIAGSGKSTLARCVYDHENMEDHFDIVMWIHVSQKFYLDSIFREMFEGATGEECPKFSSLNILKESLEKKLRGKRIFLVLDDVWYNNRNSEDREELQKLICPLHVGKAGSRILVTSRTEAALVTLGAVKERCIPISDLDDEVFLEMFMHYALQGARVSDNDRRILEMIGEDIAKKLKRSPLAARTVGSRLRETQTVEFWRSVKDRDLLNDTMGALWWSYQYLDEQVRRCFSYCSIFPRRHRLKRDELVKLWVAEGFIKTSMPEEEMEDVAKDYFYELLLASFLQLGGKEKSYKIISCDVDYFTIHDLMCDLAEEVAIRDYFRIEEGSTEEGPQDVRYLFVGAYYSEMLIEKISGLKNLRTLIIYTRISVNSTKWKVFESLFNILRGLRKLRVLKLGFIGGDLIGLLISIPDSIGQLKHLRYFAFDTTIFSKITVPGTFTKLYHMQVVDFGSCASLAFSGDMTNLVNLCRVISSSALDFPGVGRLTWLQMLAQFTIRKEQGYEPHQLKHLNKLQDRLPIRGLENVQSKEEALEVNLACKEKLTEVVLEWNSGNCGPEVHADVLEGLCPSKYLERLTTWNYHGMTLPNWMMGEHNGGPKNLQELTFIGWSQQGLAPDLGPFIHLHSLYIIRCSWDALPGMEHLKSLKILSIWACEHMQSLGTLPKSLEKFTVLYCNSELERLCNDYWAESRKDC